MLDFSSQSHHEFFQALFGREAVLILDGVQVSGGNLTYERAIAEIERAAGNPNPMLKDSFSNLVELFVDIDAARLAAAIDEKTGIFKESGFGLLRHNAPHPGYNAFIKDALDEILTSLEMTTKQKQYALYNLDIFCKELFSGKIIDPFSESAKNWAVSDQSSYLLDVWRGDTPSSWSGNYIDPNNPVMSPELVAKIEAHMGSYRSDTGYPSLSKDEAVNKLLEQAIRTGVFDDPDMQDFIASKNTSTLGEDGMPNNWHTVDGIKSLFKDYGSAAALKNIMQVLDHYATIKGIHPGKVEDTGARGDDSPYNPIAPEDPSNDPSTDHLIEKTGASKILSKPMLNHFLYNTKGSVDPDVAYQVMEALLKNIVKAPDVLAGAASSVWAVHPLPQTFDELPPMLKGAMQSSILGLAAGLGGSFAADVTEAMNHFYSAFKIGMALGDWGPMEQAALQFGVGLAVSFIMVTGSVMAVSAISPPLGVALGMAWGVIGLVDAAFNGADLLEKMWVDLGSSGGVVGHVMDFIRGTSLIVGTDGDDVIILSDEHDMVADSLGNDVYIGRGGTDTLDFSKSSLALHIDHQGFVTRIDGAAAPESIPQKDAFYEFEKLILSNLGDVVDRRLATDSMVIDGRGGDDVLMGGSASEAFLLGFGSDWVDGGAPTTEGATDRDVANYAAITRASHINGASVGLWMEGSEVVHTDMDVSSGVGLDTLMQMEAVIGTRFSDVFVSADVREIRAGTGNDRVDHSAGIHAIAAYGDDGNDSLRGGAGNDSLFGGNGNDTIEGGAGINRLDGGAGTDSLSFEHAAAGMHIDMRSGWASLVGASADQRSTVVNFEGVVGTDFNDRILTADLRDGRESSASGGAGNDTLEGHGYSSNLYGGEGNDVLYGIGSTSGLMASRVDMYGGAGDDVFYARTGNGSDGDIFGGAGNDVINASRGQFVINGGTGNDFVHAGTSTYSHESVISGGEGADVLFLQGAITVRDFDPEEDKIVINQVGMSRIDARQSGSDVVITYYWDYGYTSTIRLQNVLLNEVNSSNLRVGSLTTAKSLYAAALQEPAAPMHVIGDRYNGGQEGSTGDDTLSGLGGADRQYGYGGADDMSGDEGRDWLYGGTGNDVLWGGTDSDDLYGGSGNDRIDGGSGDDLIVGGRGNDTLNGSSGVDTFVFEGAFGADTVLDFEEGDILRFAASGPVSYQGMSTTAQGTTVKFAGMGSPSILVKGIPLHAGFLRHDSEGAFIVSGRMVSGAQGDVDEALEGGMGFDTISGFGGNDTLSGLAGSDVLFGGAGDDVFVASTGADTIEGGEGIDTLDFSHLTGGIRSMSGQVGAEYRQYYTVSSIEVVVGSASRDVVEGWSNAVQINAGAGWDRILGSDFSDTLYGGTGGDTLTGAGGADMLWGDEGDDLLVGSFGDTLYGGSGQDVVQAVEGGVVLFGGADADVFDIAEGVRNVRIEDFVQAEDFVQFSLPADRLLAGITHYEDERGIGTIVSFARGEGDIEELVIEGVVFDPAWMVVKPESAGLVQYVFDGRVAGMGTDEDDDLIGTLHNDSIDGGWGRDTIFGDDGADVLWGGEDDDVLAGGQGADTLYGGAGSDMLFGLNESSYFGPTAGRDLDTEMWGGEGRDEFVFESGFGNTIIMDFSREDSLYAYDYDMVLKEVVFVGNDTELRFEDTRSWGFGNGEVVTITLKDHVLDANRIEDYGYGNYAIYGEWA